MLATRPTNTDLMIGGQNDVQSFASRIRSMMRGGEKLTDRDAMSLAQFSMVTNLNPFIGECWWIPGSGAMVGIAGARRKDQEKAAERGGYSFPIVTSCSPEEAGATEAEIKDVVAAFKTEINDSGATAEYQKLFSATIQALREAGHPDPFAGAKEICGPRPVWIGYGFSKKSEPSRMNKVQLARKRSEADALKKRIVIPFGANVAPADASPDYGGEDWRADVVDAGEDEPSTTPTIAQIPTPQTIATRPYTPEQLQARLMEISREKQKQNKLSANQPQRGLVASMLEQCFAGDPDSDKIRHSVTKYLIGYDSLKDVPGTFILALLDWLKPEKDSGGAYHVDPMASKEARSVWTEALKDAGQISMDLKSSAL